MINLKKCGYIVYEGWEIVNGIKKYVQKTCDKKATIDFTYDASGRDRPSYNGSSDFEGAYLCKEHWKKLKPEFENRWCIEEKI